MGKNVPVHILFSRIGSNSRERKQKMTEEVFSIELPVGEKLTIRKNRIKGDGAGEKRLALVTGIHGDEFEG